MGGNTELTHNIKELFGKTEELEAKQSKIETEKKALQKEALKVIKEIVESTGLSKDQVAKSLGIREKRKSSKIYVHKFTGQTWSGLGRTPTDYKENPDNWEVQQAPVK